MEGIGQETVVDYLKVPSLPSTGINHKSPVVLHKETYDTEEKQFYEFQQFKTQILKIVPVKFCILRVCPL